MKLNNVDADRARGGHCHERGTSAEIPREHPFGMNTAGRVRPFLRQTMGDRGQQGLTLVELIVTIAILAILASVAYPIARFQIQRQKEQVLRDDLWQMRHAIDKYKDAADRQAFQTSIDSYGYPPDLDTLVNGVDVQGHTVRFLRAIPVDPMTGKKDWVLRSMQDDPDSDSWGGQNVFDVHSASDGTALDGTKYNTW
ncbi:MAG TPA: type II secretion system protein [Acidobacteriaceae bacterium]|nr:type II secretion system protein [Acidobacteriaceae bacterium]